jgi:predicted ATP-grasp superfamily ATP-dependent carboligase
MRKVDVLLTYGWVRSTYAALRNLAKHGLRVAVCDNAVHGMCQYSRFSRGFFLCESPFPDNSDGFIRGLKRVADETRPILLLPSHDETEIIARQRDHFEPSVIIPIADVSSIEMANDKSRMSDYVETCGLSVPSRIRFESPEAITKLTRADTRYVVKLRQSNGAKGIFYSRGPEETRLLVERLVRDFHLPPERKPVVQEWVPGEGWGVSCLYWHGERIASFTHRRLREKTASGGTSTLREGRANPILENAAHRLLDSLHWHGLVMVEFKYNQGNGNYWFIETNPRLWGSIRLAIDSGVEFPFLLFLCATEGPDVARKYVASIQRKNLVARWYLGDLISSVGLLTAGQFNLNALRLWLPGGADVYDDLFLDDPLVFLGEIVHYVAGFMKTRSINPAEEGTLG